jgi:NADH:ubiquinone reductase (H+-translocating)
MSDSLPRVVIVGGGFAGLAAAKALRKTPARIPLIDHCNHRPFQALLYEFATSVFTPGQIGSPIRGVLHKQSNATVILGEVTSVERAKKTI